MSNTRDLERESELIGRLLLDGVTNQINAAANKHIQKAVDEFTSELTGIIANTAKHVSADFDMRMMESRIVLSINLPEYELRK